MAEEPYPKSLYFNYSRRDGIGIVHVIRDSLDASYHDEAKFDLIKYLEKATENHQGFIMDLGNVTLVDASGIGLMLSGMRYLNSKGIELKIAEMTEPVRALFELVRMHKIFEIYTTVEEAVESLPQKPIQQ